MSKNVVITAMIVAVLLLVHVGWGARTYTYVETVGDGHEHQTIQAAIDAMREHPLGPGALGCIEVYPGTYEHNAGFSYSSDKSKWIPQYCDLIGTEEDRRLGGMITVLTEAVKGLNEKLEALAAENQILKAEIAALKAE